MVHAEPGKTKVRQFHIELAREQYVLALEIPMGDILAVQVVQAGRHLTKPQSRLLFRHYAVVLHEIQKIAIIGIAHENEDARTTL